MLPTLAAAAGEPDVVEKLKKGYKSGNKTFKVHIDGYNLLPFLKGEVKENPRKGFLYWSDDGDLMALRVGNWKVHVHGAARARLACGRNRWLRCGCRTSTTSAAIRSSGPRGRVDVLCQVEGGSRVLLVPAQQIVGEFLQTFKEFPPRQRPASFSIDQALEKARKSRRRWPRAAGPASSSARTQREGDCPRGGRLSAASLMMRHAGHEPGSADDPAIRSPSSTRTTPIRLPSKIWIARATSGETRTGIAPSTTCCGPAGRTAPIWTSSSPDAERGRPPSTRCAGPPPASPASTSARRASITPSG